MPIHFNTGVTRIPLSKTGQTLVFVLKAQCNTAREARGRIVWSLTFGDNVEEIQLDCDRAGPKQNPCRYKTWKMTENFIRAYSLNDHIDCIFCGINCRCIRGRAEHCQVLHELWDVIGVVHTCGDGVKVCRAYASSKSYWLSLCDRWRFREQLELIPKLKMAQKLSSGAW